MRQAHRERTTRAGLDTTVGTAANLAAPLLDNPPTRMGQTGVDTQNNFFLYRLYHTITSQGKAPSIIHERLF